MYLLISTEGTEPSTEATCMGIFIHIHICSSCSCAGFPLTHIVSDTLQISAFTEIAPDRAYLAVSTHNLPNFRAAICTPRNAPTLFEPLVEIPRVDLGSDRIIKY